VLARAIETSGARPGPEFECPYLPDRLARHLAIAPVPLGPGTYDSLMSLGFRRSGAVFYRPACRSCAECQPLRVDVRRFQPRRSQRRCHRLNVDVCVAVATPSPDDEKLALYRRYLAARHDGQMSGSADEFERFLYGSPLVGIELTYRVEGRLIAVGLADIEPQAASAVYCFYDPAEPRRSLGVLNVLELIAECRRRALPWLHLGYYVAGSRAMDYKARFGPHELLGPDGWAPGPPAALQPVPASSVGR
jgi:arginine-tRNA-protein transferase